jgi:hypothetical protein
MGERPSHELSIRGTFTGAVRVARRRHPAAQSQA